MYRTKLTPMSIVLKNKTISYVSSAKIPPSTESQLSQTKQFMKNLEKCNMYPEKKVCRNNKIYV